MWPIDYTYLVKNKHSSVSNKDTSDPRLDWIR